MAPLAPLADPELFAIDSAGSTSVRSALLHEYNQGGVSRRRKGAAKPLRSAQIIADRNAATTKAINPSAQRVSKRKREDEGGVSKALRRKLEIRAKRDAKGEGLWSVASSKSKRVNEVSHAVKEGGTYDAWTVDQLAAARKAALPEAIRDVVDLPQPKPPVSLRRHHILNEAAPRPIPTPHPGTSYNPTQTEHQHLLRKALSLAEVEETTRKADEATRERLDAVRAAEKGKELWEHAEADVDRQEAVLEGDEEEATGEVRKASKRKTEKAKRKAALNRKAERLAAKVDKHTLAALPGVVRRLKNATSLSAARRSSARQAQLAILADRGLAGKRVGVSRAPAAKVDYQLGEELADGLRTLKPEGNLWRDWQGSATRRGMTEVPRVRTSEKRRAKTKSVEKHSWKRFE